MSLTSLLGDRDSALRALFARELPGVADLRASYRAQLPTPLSLVLPEASPGRPAYSGLGMAIDHRLRLALAVRCHFRDGAVGIGVKLTTAPALGLTARTAAAVRGAGEALLDELDRLAKELAPSDRSRPILLSTVDEERLCRACFVATWFEELYRTAQVRPGTPLGLADADTTLDDLLAAVPHYVVADLIALVSLAESGLGPLRRSCDPAEVITGPTFAGSADVGGADADFIAGGVLCDVKATIKPATLNIPEIYQLAGYMLLDYDDEYGIDRVGWYLARAGCLVEWGLDEFFSLLGATRTVSDLRLLTSSVLP